MNQWIDKAKPVRAGEELDINRLQVYLQKQLGLQGDLQVSQFPSGFSNLTYMLTINGRELVLRRPPFGVNIKSAHDMGREYTILSKLHPVYNKVPRPLGYCEDETVLGAPFYVMERVRGVILRANMPTRMIPKPALMGDIAQALVNALAELHAIDIDTAGLGNFGKPAGYVTRQIEGWTRRYQRAQTDNLPDIEAMATWLAKNMPPESAPTLIHNDFKYDNVVLNPDDWTEIKAILDWEMATIGDPLLDLGTSLGYWVQATDPPPLQALSLSPTTLPGNPNRADLVKMYEEASGRTVAHPVFYFVYGLFKVAVIIQQIYARYKAGHTQDPRFAGLIYAVRACGEMGTQMIAQGNL